MNDPSNATLPRAAAMPTQLGKFLIPPNTLVAFNIYASHHVEATWTDNEYYNPERFMMGQTLHRLVASSFSLGPRQCPAKNFAMWELRTIVTILLKEYEWMLPQDSIHHDRIHNAFAFGTNINQPYDLNIIFTKRTTKA